MCLFLKFKISASMSSQVFSAVAILAIHGGLVADIVNDSSNRPSLFTLRN